MGLPTAVVVAALVYMPGSCSFTGPSDSICGKVIEGEVRRVMVGVESLRFECIPQSAATAAGFKEFPVAYEMQLRRSVDIELCAAS